MNRRFIIILGIVFVGLVILTVWQNLPQASAPTTVVEDDPAALLPDAFIGREINLTVDSIQAIRLRNPLDGSSFTLSRDPAGQWIAPESAGQLDPATALNIVRTVVIAPIERTEPINPGDDLSQFGFTPEGNLSIEVLKSDGSGHVIAIGGLTANEVTYYVLIDDLPRIFLVNRGAVEYLRQQITNPPLT
jgi:hypothetical protein